MRLLLDTHIFLWFVSGASELFPRFRDPGNQIYVSVVSVWETIIKWQLGKLPLPEPPGLYLPRQRDAHQFASLTVSEADVLQLTALPPLHRNPFDRLLICQAIQHGLTLVTVDDQVRAYPVSILSAT